MGKFIIFTVLFIFTWPWLIGFVVLDRLIKSIVEVEGSSVVSMAEVTTYGTAMFLMFSAAVIFAVLHRHANKRVVRFEGRVSEALERDDLNPDTRQLLEQMLGDEGEE